MIAGSDFFVSSGRNGRNMCILWKVIGEGNPRACDSIFALSLLEGQLESAKDYRASLQ